METDSYNDYSVCDKKLKPNKRYTALCKLLQAPSAPCWSELLPYVVNNYLDLPSILTLRQCNSHLYRSRYSVLSLPITFWNTLTEQEIIQKVLPQLRSCLMVASFQHINFSRCCLLTDTFPKSLMQQVYARHLKSLIFDFCYALSDKSLEILCATPLPALEALSLRCARSRDLTGLPFTKHLNKTNWPRFHQLSCSCTTVTLPHLDTAARFITENALELNTSPKLGIAGSSASYQLINRLSLNAEYSAFLNAIIHLRSTEQAQKALHAFERKWIQMIEAPEHKTKILHRLLRNRATACLVNIPCSVSIISSSNCKWIVTEDQRATSLPSRYYVSGIDEKENNKDECDSITHELCDQDGPIIDPSSSSSSGAADHACVNSDRPTSDQSPFTESPSTVDPAPPGSSPSIEPPPSDPPSSHLTSSDLPSSDPPPIDRLPSMRSKPDQQCDSKIDHVSSPKSEHDPLSGGADRTGARWMYPLQLAIRTGSLDMVKFLVEQGAHVDVWGYNFATPLYIACSSLHRVGVQTVYTKITSSSDTETPHIDDVSSSRGHSASSLLSTCKESYDYMQSVDSPEQTQQQTSDQPELCDQIHRQFTFGIGYHCDSTTAPSLLLHSTPQQETMIDRRQPSDINYSITHYLLEAGASVDSPDLYSNKCPINVAIKYNNRHLLELLIKKGAKLNVRSLPPESINTNIQHSRRHLKKSTKYKSSLYWACELEAWNCVECLLKHGADPHWKDPFSHQSLTPALLSYRRNPSILSLFLKYKTGAKKEHRWVLSEVLGAAILYDDIQTITTLITQYPDLTKQTSNGMWSLPLLQASRLDKCDIINLLLKFGADINAHNSEGLTSLHCAANEGRYHALQCLLQNGAQPNLKGGVYGKTPLHLAVEENHIHCVPILLTHGASITVQDHAGHTPLMTAIAARHDSIASLIVASSNSSDLDTVDYGGRSALMYAIYFGQFKVADALVNSGVNCHIVDQSGSSAESLLIAKINSFGKGTSVINKLIRHLIQQQDIQSTVQQATTVDELNSKRKKTAKALLKRIRSSKKPTVLPKRVVDLDKRLQPPAHENQPDIPDQLARFPEWDLYGFGDDYELESDMSMSELSETSSTSKSQHF